MREQHVKPRKGRCHQQVLPAIVVHPFDEQPTRIPEVGGARSRPAVVTPLECVIGHDQTELALGALLRPCWPEYEQAEVRVTDVDVDEVCPIVLVVERHRLQRVEALLEGYELAGITPFSPALVGIERGKRGKRGYRLLVPPVVEYSSRGRELVDGTHRLYTLRRNGRARTRALVVEPYPGGEFSQPAGRPGTWERTRVVARKRDRHSRFDGYKPELFRPVGPFFSSGRWEFDSVEHCRYELELLVKERSRPQGVC
jgi:hypothetical protein